MRCEVDTSTETKPEAENRRQNYCEARLPERGISNDDLPATVYVDIMALNRKYAALPDLDSAPDTYETPSLTDDTSNTARSTSAASSYQDFEDASPNISRSRLQPDSARATFEPTRIDAKDVDFSDRVNGKRKSYKVSSRLGDLSDEEDEDGDGRITDESLERKIARLRRECEEVKGELERRRIDREAKDGDKVSTAVEDEASTLGKMLAGFEINGGNAGAGSADRLIKALSTNTITTKPQSSEAPNPEDSSTYTVTYAPTYQSDHDIAKAAAFDSRLTQLERSLGITSTAIPALDPKGTPVAILPKLDTLQRQIAILLESTPASLDTISRRVRTLTSEAERLTEARKAAKAARDELRNSGVVEGTKSAAELEDSEQIAKINALYGVLPTIENLAPLLPALLDRLKSLRTIHADAAKAHEGMERALKRQEDIGAEIKRWREGLEKVEAVVGQGEETLKGNVEVVEGWVKELEERVAKFSG